MGPSALPPGPSNPAPYPRPRPRPRHRRPGRPRAPVRHLRRHRVGDRVREGVQHRGPVVPLASPGRAPQGRDRLELDCHVVLRILHNHRYAGAFTFGRHRDIKLPGGKLSRTILPREEWISFIPGAHPGYITLDQYDANRAQLAANAAAHGRDRAAGPPREGPALLQGIIICGTCGLRMTVRYHQRRGRELPTYVCQRDGISHGRKICQAIPGGSLDERIGQLLTGTLTPLAIEAALTVTAELEHRAAEAGALRAAHVERARYHADL